LSEPFGALPRKCYCYYYYHYYYYFCVQLNREVLTVKGREDWTQHELEEVLARRFLQADVRLNLDGQVRGEWQGTTQQASVRIRGGRSEPEEEPDGEEEDEDDGAWWETEEDTRELLAGITAQIREHDEVWRTQEALRHRIERYLEIMNRIQAETTDPERTQRLQTENRLLEQALAEMNEGWRREHRWCIRHPDRKRREECGLARAPDGWALCKLRWQRDARWIMVSPGDAEGVIACACTIWGQRRYVLSEEMEMTALADWHRKVIRLTSAGWEERQEVVFHVVLDRSPERILGFVGMSALTVREVIRARFRTADFGLSWDEQPVDESWADTWRLI
jgi:hypothetical protein